MPGPASSRINGGSTPGPELQDIFDNAPIGIFTSTPAGRYLTANPALARMLGRESPQELVESVTSIADQVYADPRDRAALMRLLEERGQAVEHECRLRRGDGSVFWASVSAVAVRDGRGAVTRCQGFITDISERKAAEEKLLTSRKVFSGALSMARLGHWELDASGSSFLLSDSLYELLRTSAEEMGGYAMPVEEYARRFVFPGDRGHFVGEIGRALEAQDFDSVRYFEHRVLHANGAVDHFAVRFFIEKDEQGGTIRSYGVNQDITERKRAEEAERRERADRDLLARISVAAIKADGLMPFQLELLRLLGETLDVSRAYVFTYRPDAETMDNTAEWAAPGVTPQQGNLQGVPADRQWWWIDTLMQGRAIEFTDIADIPDERTARDLRAQDIRSVLVLPLFIGTRFRGFVGLDECRHHRRWTTRERDVLTEAVHILMGVWADDDLRRSEERFRGILRNVPTVAVQGYTLDGTVSYWNRASETLYGYTEDEALGRNLLDLIIPPDMRDEVRAAMLRMIETGENIPASELTLRRKDGSPIPVYSSHALVRVPGRNAELFCIDVDHSEIRATHARLAQARDAAEAANRSKSEFLANMSHEIRTPLNGILGMLQLLDISPLSEEQRQFCSLAMQSTDRLTRLLSDILDLSRIEAGKMHLREVPFSLREVVGQVMDLFVPISVQSEVMLQHHLGADLPDTVVGDPLRLQQVLINLIGNAFKFTDQGRILLEVHPLSPARPGQARLFFTVSDTGQGIADESMGALFRPFSQAVQGYRRNHQGAGLGLAICKHLVFLMGGNMAVESEPGLGTSVHFCIAVGDGAGAHAPARKDSRFLPDGRQVRILVVEDDEVSLFALRKLLERGGHRVEAARNGREALNLLDGRDFDLIIMDVQMPVMDGLEATRRIRRSASPEKRDVPIIAMTAYAMSGDRERILAAGMNAYVAKPVGIDDLAPVIEEVLRA